MCLCHAEFAGFCLDVGIVCLTNMFVMDFTYTTVRQKTTFLPVGSVRRAPLSRTILHLIFVVSTGGFLLQLAQADMLGLPSSAGSNYIPRIRPDFDLHDIPCDLSRPDKPCTLPGKSYPWFAMNSYIEDNKAMLKRMYGDTCERDAGKHARLRAQGPMSRQGREQDKPDVGFVNACPSEQFVVTPFWANNSAGTTLAIVNFHPFEQAVQQEVCKPGTSGRCRDGCRCEQKYSWYRLLAFDPRNECRGIFMDWFQFPSCCACHCYEVDPSSKEESHLDLPLPKMGTLTSPAPSATTALSASNNTTEADFDYDNETDPTTTPLATVTATTTPIPNTVTTTATPSTAKPRFTLPASSSSRIRDTTAPTTSPLWVNRTVTATPPTTDGGWPPLYRRLRPLLPFPWPPRIRVV
ncbi:protein spaetzle 4-like isoform X2 [Paramacrobiotus metropolitanus]|uniref:protein spaetzle 4-like isoform X2 n=1 Tax=Paramacrobiotus metropolitanus TaxID=2943436 RepID=UPI002445D979|nr:protein spaetzle 4-like isoform X2 [Paramacrobiotus metropolitanus]